MSEVPTATRLAGLRVEAVTLFGKAVTDPGYDSALSAINAIGNYTLARQAWHDAHSDEGDLPIWEDPWRS